MGRNRTDRIPTHEEDGIQFSKPGRNWNFYFLLHGKRVRQSAKTPDLPKAIQTAKSVRVSLSGSTSNNGVKASDSPAKFFEDYYIRQERAGRNNKTLENYKRFETRFRTFFAGARSRASLLEVTVLDVEDWRDWLTVQKLQSKGQEEKAMTPKTVKEHLVWLASVYKKYNQTFNGYNPATSTSVSRPANKKRKSETLKYYTPQEITTLQNVAMLRMIKNQGKPVGIYEDFFWWLIFLTYTGVRIHEAQGIRIADIDKAKRSVKVFSKKDRTVENERELFLANIGASLDILTKTQPTNPANLSDDISDLIPLVYGKGKTKAQIQKPAAPVPEFIPGLPNPYVIIHNPYYALTVLESRRLDYDPATPPETTLYTYYENWFYKMLKNTCRIAKVPFKGVHAIRHSFVSKAIQTWNVGYLKNFIGHSSLSQTLDLYSHLIPTETPAFSY